VRPQAATLRLAVFPHAGLVTDALLVCAGALLMAAAAQVSIPLPFTPVPITGQTFAAVLIGASLGSLLGLASLSL
jgi:biotin transport system substrate-specific component